jgi:hypothetical protein
MDDHRKAVRIDRDLVAPLLVIKKDVGIPVERSVANALRYALKEENQKFWLIGDVLKR